MANSIDLQGMRFGRLFVVEKTGRQKMVQLYGNADVIVARKLW